MADTTYTVIVEKGWSYVIGPTETESPEFAGPWRYQWEAQEYADDLNSGRTKPNALDSATTGRQTP